MEIANFVNGKVQLSLFVSVYKKRLFHLVPLFYVVLEVRYDPEFLRKKSNVAGALRQQTKTGLSFLILLLAGGSNCSEIFLTIHPGNSCKCYHRQSVSESRLFLLLKVLRRENNFY